MLDFCFGISGSASGTVCAFLFNVRGMQIIRLDANIYYKCIQLFRLILFLLPLTLLSEAIESVWRKGSILPMKCGKGHGRRKTVCVGEGIEYIG